MLAEKHPLYEIQINDKSKWLTRDKLRKCKKALVIKMNRLVMLIETTT